MSFADLGGTILEATLESVGRVADPSDGTYGIELWLDDARHDPRPEAAPWRTSFTPGRIGASVAKAPPVDRSWCAGSHTEPTAASQYHGRGLCRVCRDDVLINRNGLLRKHRRPSW